MRAARLYRQQDIRVEDVNVLGVQASEDVLVDVARSAHGFAELFGDLTGRLGVDLVAECSGPRLASVSPKRACRPPGPIVRTGLPTMPAPLDATPLLEKDVTLDCTCIGTASNWSRIVRLIAAGKYPVGRVVTGQLAHEDVLTSGFDVLIDPRGDQLKILTSPAVPSFV